MSSAHVMEQKVACFPADEAGREALSLFQRINRIVDIKPSEMVREGKKEPCAWILFLPGLDPYQETPQISAPPAAAQPTARDWPESLVTTPEPVPVPDDKSTSSTSRSGKLPKGQGVRKGVRAPSST